MQKLVLASNRLPQPDSVASHLLRITASQDEDMQKLSDLQQLAKTNLSKLIQSFNTLQDLMIERGACPAVKKTGKKTTEGEEDDEEIPSDDDEEIASDDDEQDKLDEDHAFGDDDEEGSDDDEGTENSQGSNDEEAEKERKKKKRKITLEIDDQDRLLEKRFRSFNSVRDSILDEWYNKTRFSTMVKGSKGMQSFEQPPTAQIRAIVSDKKRLLRRTQLKRSDYVVIGKTEEEQSETSLFSSKKDDNYDPEIFDDDDFYHQLLRELIANKTSEGCDSLAINKKWLEIQKMRSRMKKKVDTKASKGRKIKYDTHKELVNFMAPVTHFEFTEQAKDELFASLFQ